MVDQRRTLSTMVRRMLSKPWAHTAYDLAIALLVAYATSYYSQGYDGPIGLSMAAAVVFRRRRPMTVMVVVSALALTQYALAQHSPEPLAGNGTGYDVAVLIAMVAVVSHAEQMWKAYAAGGVVLLGTVLAFSSSVFSAADAEVDLVGLVATAGLCAAVWLTAYVLRTRRMYVAVLEERAATAEREHAQLARLAAAEERADIARELHDVVAHSLAVMIVQADGASYSIEADRDGARKALQTIAATGRDALEDMRSIVGVLRGTKAPDAETDDDRRQVGLAHLEPLVERARSAGLHVDLRIEGEPDGLSAADELTLFRLAQEGLTNALRHAGPAAQVTVTLRFGDGTAVVEVVDDGAGRLAAAAEVPGSGGNGLVGMRERVAVHGGRFTAGPRLGPGWQVRAELPVRPAV